MMDNPSYLGQGWAFPPAFVKGSPTIVVMSSDEENINENLKTLLSTQVGERLLEFGYGTKLKTMTFGKIDAVLVRSIKDTIKRGILLNERRISLEDIVVDLSESRQGVLNIRINYLIKKTNDRSNVVYPFHLTEGTNINL